MPNMNTNNLLTLIGIVVTLIISLLAFFEINEVIFAPDINVSVEFGYSRDYTNKETEEPASFAMISIFNNGTAPATNLRVVINPSHEILKGKKEYLIERVTLEQPGTKSYVIETSRLTVGDNISYSFITNSNINEENYIIWVAYDQGKPVKYDTKIQGKKYLPNYETTKYYQE